MADPIFTMDNWLPMEPKPDDFISPPIIVWNYPTKEERQKTLKSKWRNQWQRKYASNNKKNKKIIIDYYSNGLQECACCRVKSSLTVDHINGGGVEHRKKVGRGVLFYTWLIRNNLPPGYQILCFDCNLSKNAGTSCKIDHSKEGRLN